MNKTELKALIPTGRVYFKDEGEMDEQTFAAYGTDRTRKYPVDFDTLVMPGSTEEVAQLVRYCRRNKLKLVPSGGRTGLAGGAVARHKEIVLSLERMNRVLDFDPGLRTLRVEAGVITANLQQEARERGLYFPVDFASSGSSTIGGNLATNAGGIHVIRYGMIRDWVRGLTAVSGTGEILKFSGDIIKDNAGFDLKQLLVGSEGTLGIITEATMGLTTAPGETTLLLFALSSFEKTLELLYRVRSRPLNLLAFEAFDGLALEKVLEHLDLRPPAQSKHEWYVLMEYEGDGGGPELLESLFADGLVDDGFQAQSSAARKTFWAYREGISESLSLQHTVHKNDISLPLRNMTRFLELLPELLKRFNSGFQAAIFGHLGDGNLHVNVIKPESLTDPEFFTLCESMDPEIFSLLGELSGSISAEHGLGLLKKDFLSHTTSPAAIRIMHEIKRIFDPEEILNPGKVLPEKEKEKA